MIKESHGDHAAYIDNKFLNKAEYSLGKLFLYSMPRYLTVVLGNGCNINCRHCYQLKNGDNLLRDRALGADLRRELSVFYPFLSTLRLQGGEVFALPGFETLLDDVGAFVKRPLVSISTNATLIDERWAQRLVDLPLQSMTVSIDAGTAGTFERLRKGAKFQQVIDNIRRIQGIKHDRRSAYPVLDAFFVIMRSNFREIPVFLNLLLSLGIKQASFQMMHVDARNLDREPDLVNEVIEDPEDVRALHVVLQQVLNNQAPSFCRLAWCGLQSLFANHDLRADFLDERSSTLTPDQGASEAEGDGRAAADSYDLPPEAHPEFGDFPKLCMDDVQTTGACPNPWSTLFLTEDGDVSLCFLSEPIGNVYEAPLIHLWNCAAAIAKRSDILHGRYMRSGCPERWCNWREGSQGAMPTAGDWRKLLEISALSVKRLQSRPQQAAHPPLESGETSVGLQAVRRLLQERNARIHELEAGIGDLWGKNGQLHDAGRMQIDRLEDRVAELQRRLLRRSPLQWCKFRLDAKLRRT